MLLAAGMISNLRRPDAVPGGLPARRAARRPSRPPACPPAGLPARPSRPPGRRVLRADYSASCPKGFPRLDHESCGSSPEAVG